MTEFKYTQKEIVEIESLLKEIKGKLLISEDLDLSILVDYSTAEHHVKRWFSNKKETYYIISSLQINHNGSIKTYDKSGSVMCSHIVVKKLYDMKEFADSFFKKLKNFNYTITCVDKINEQKI